MKRNLFLILAACGLILSSCQKELEVQGFSFDVKSVNRAGSETNTFKLGDTIGFKFTGNPDIITFYSGQIGARYEFRERTEADGSAQLQFSTVLSGGSSAVAIPNTLSLLVSDDFKGVVNRTVWEIVTRDTAASSANIASATWTDITNRATLSNGANSTAVASGVVDLSDFAAKNKPVYIAFKYAAPADVPQPKWVINPFQIKNVLPDGTSYTIANFNGPTASISNYGYTSFSPGWVTSFDPALNTNKNVAWTYTAVASSNNPQRVEITGATTAGAAKAAEAWAIIGPINLKKVTPDLGVGIKNIINRLPDYTIPKASNYTVAGQYNATFVASSNTTDQTSSKVKQVQITINP